MRIRNCCFVVGCIILLTILCFFVVTAEVGPWKDATLSQARAASDYGRSLKDASYYSLIAPWTIRLSGNRFDFSRYSSAPRLTVETPLLRIAWWAWDKAKDYYPAFSDSELDTYLTTYRNQLCCTLSVYGNYPTFMSGWTAAILQGDLVLHPEDASIPAIADLSARWPNNPAYTVLLFFYFDVVNLDTQRPFVVKIIQSAGELTFPVNIRLLGTDGFR